MSIRICNPTRTVTTYFGHTLQTPPPAPPLEGRGERRGLFVLANLKFLRPFGSKRHPSGDAERASSEYEDLPLDLWSLATEGTQESDKNGHNLFWSLRGIIALKMLILATAEFQIRLNGGFAIRQERSQPILVTPWVNRIKNAYTRYSRISNPAERQIRLNGEGRAAESTPRGSPPLHVRGESRPLLLRTFNTVFFPFVVEGKCGGLV